MKTTRDESMKLQETEKDYEDFVDLIGGFDKWQKTLIATLAWFSFTSAINNMSWPFVSLRADFWCARTPKYLNISVEEWRNISAPMEIRGGMAMHSRCQVYDLDNENGNLSIIPCSSWEFDHSMVKSSIIEKWNLVCDNYWMISFAGSTYFMGVFVSAFVSGQLSDRFGRRPIIISGLIIHIIFGFMCTFSPFYWMFALSRCLIAIGKTAYLMSFFIYVLEVVRPNDRENIFVIGGFCYTTGMLILVGVAWLLKDWFYIQLFSSLPPIIDLFFTRFIPESPRWLLTHGKLGKAEKVIKEIMKRNNKNVSGLTEIIEELHYKIKKGNKKSRRNFLDLFKKRELRKITLVISAMWLIIKYNLYALSLNPDIAGGNIFLLFLLFSLLNYFAVGGMYIVLHRFGRRRIEMFLCIIVGIFLLLLTAVPKEMTWLRVVFIVLTRFFSSIGAATLTGFTTELFPTVVRSVGFGFCSTCGRIGAILSPYMKDLSDMVDWRLPFIISGILMIVVGFFVLPLPETKSTRLKDTIGKYKKQSEVEEKSIE